MQVLVTGGAGYIGSHALRALLRSGHTPVALDNLSRGHREAVPSDVPFIELDVRDTEALTQALSAHRIECVMHFAAFAYVGESVAEPLAYYDNNTRGTLSVLEAMERAEVTRLVFSSTCASYGVPEELPIRETTPQAPINPYGSSKLMSEIMIRDYAAKTPSFAHAALRYFNVAGAAEDGSVGEDHDPETHLIPVILQAALGRREGVTIFGEDYPTPDGTCVRDYIHVEDLARAHLLALTAARPGEHLICNLGNGNGFSNRQVVEVVREVTGHPVPVKVAPRREGDPATLVASADRARTVLGWVPRKPGLREMVIDAWDFYRSEILDRWPA